MIIPLTFLAVSKDQPPPPWFVLCFPFAFIGLWLLVTFIISRTGWVRFGRAYPCPTRPSGPSFTAPNASFGFCGARYNNAVCGVATEGGLYLRAVLIFSAFHTPFLLPWSSVTRIVRNDGWFVKGYTLHVQDSVGMFQIRFRQSFESELRRYVPKLLDAPVPSTFPFIK